MTMFRYLWGSKGLRVLVFWACIAGALFGWGLLP